MKTFQLQIRHPGGEYWTDKFNLEYLLPIIKQYTSQKDTVIIGVCSN